MPSSTQQGIDALRAGDRASAVHFLGAALQQNPDDLSAWLWLSGALKNDQKRADALLQVLRLDPTHQAALRGLEELASRGITPVDIMAEEEIEAEDIPPSYDNTPTRPTPRQIVEWTQAPLQTTERPSLAGRAAMTLVLMIGFYVLAVTIAAALLFIIYAEFFLLGRFNLQITLACLFGAIAILWSIFPRVERFRPPGARLTAAQHPQLFKLILSVAKRMDQDMPEEVYLVPDVNAFVGEYGGLLGFGTKRILGIGLPLFEALTVPQLRAVLAHEFGHYFSGDTRLGPWIYRIRTAIIRTVNNLHQNSILQAPFRWYGRLFLRVTQSISRRQELVADELSAQVAGSQPTLEGVNAVHGLDAAFRTYWEQEIIPILSKGYLPPLGDGFSHFVQTEHVSEAITQILDQQKQTVKTDPYDSHPSLKERIDALQAMPSGPDWKKHAPAITLLVKQPGLEEDLLQSLYGPEKIRSLKPVDWQSVGKIVYLPVWQEMVRLYQPALSGFSAERLPAFRGPNGDLAQILRQKANTPMKTEDLVKAVDRVLGMALAVCLAGSGWIIQALPGEDVIFLKAGDQLAPFTEVNRLAKGELGQAEWLYLCEDTGIFGTSCF